MAEKTSTVIVKVDLSCCRCNKSIRKVLDGCKDRWDIKTIEYDEKNCTVKLCGTFVPEKLIERLCKKACKIILDITIVPEEDKKEDEPPKCKCQCKITLDINTIPEDKPKPKCKCKCPTSEHKPCPIEPPCSYPCPYPYPSPHPLPIYYPPKCKPLKSDPPKCESPKPKPCPPKPPCPCPCPYPLPICYPHEYCEPCPETPRPPPGCACNHGPPCGCSEWCERPGYGRPTCRLVYEEEGSNCSIM